MLVARRQRPRNPHPLVMEKTLANGSKLDIIRHNCPIAEKMPFAMYTAIIYYQ